LKLRHTAIAALVLCVLAGWIYFYEYRGETGRQKAEVDAKKVAVFDSAQAESLTLSSAAGKICLAKRDGLWWLEEPLAARADEDEVSGLLSTISFLEITGRLGAPSSGLEAFKLANPALEVRLGPGPGKPEVRFSVGDKTPVGSAYFARLGDAGEVVTVSASVQKLMETTGEALRYKKILGIDSWQVTRFGIEQEGRAVSFMKKESDWRLEKPIAFPADRRKVSSLIYELSALRADGFEAPETDPASVGLDRPAAVLTVDGKEKTVIVQFSRVDGEGVVRARRDDMREIFRLKSEALAKLTVAVDEFRDARVAPVDRWAISELRAETSGEQKLLFKDPEANWRWGSPEGPVIESASVDSLLDAIEGARAVGYREGSAAPAGSAAGSILKLEVKAGEGDALVIRMGAEEEGRVLFTTTAAASLYEVEKGAAEKLVEVARGLRPPDAPAAASSRPGQEPAP